MSIRRYLILLAGSCLTALVLGLAPATVGHAAFPDKPIRLIVPFAPGGGVDIVARILSTRLPEILGQPVVIENRPGAGGAVGFGAVAHAAADGYMIGIAAQGLATLPATMDNLSFDPGKDLIPVTHLVNVPVVLAVNRDVPANTLGQLLQMGREQPGKLNVAVSGPGTAMPVALLELETGIKTTIIPYGGTGPAALSVVKGETDFLVFDYTTIKPFVRDGALRVLGVAGKSRLADIPDVPTLKELGVNLEMDIWYGIFVAARTPQPILDTLDAAFRKVLTQPDVIEKLKIVDALPVTSTREEFTKFYLRQIDLWRDVVKRSGYTFK